MLTVSATLLEILKKLLFRALMPATHLTEYMCVYVCTSAILRTWFIRCVHALLARLARGKKTLRCQNRGHKHAETLVRIDVYVVCRGRDVCVCVCVYTCACTQHLCTYYTRDTDAVRASEPVLPDTLIAGQISTLSAGQHCRFVACGANLALL